VRNIRLVSVVVVLLILAISAARWLAHQNTLAAKIPGPIRDAVMAHYGDPAGVSFRAYAVRGDHSFVVTESRYPPGAPWLSYDFFRISSTQNLNSLIIPQPMQWSGGKFEAGCSFGYDSKGNPCQAFAVGVAFDKAISRVVGVTADGRTTEAEVFDGFWWMTSPTDPYNYAKDLWTKIVAYDAEGKALYDCAPQYPPIH